VRHPIYLGHLLMLLGWSLGSGLAVLYALTAFAIVTGALMIRWEERELERRFGQQYREYKRRVPAIVPRRLKPFREKNEAFFLLDQIVRRLPDGAASVSWDGDGATLKPTNPRAASVWVAGEGENFIISAGEGLWHEHVESADEVRKICEWVIRGEFKEKLIWRGEKIVGTTLYEPSDSYLSGSFALGNPLRSKRVEVREYEPYF
jgi:hypothetical protein